MPEFEAVGEFEAMVASGSGDIAEWRSLLDELDAWANSGREVAFWWRDDDASRSSAPLDRLLHLSDVTNVPVTLAVVPAWLDGTLPRRLAGKAGVLVCQHGWQHRNHAKGTGDKGAWELGLHRGHDAVLCDLKQGHEVLLSAFSDQFVRVIAPPWNNIDLRLFTGLAAAGYIGVSAFANRPDDLAADRLQPGLIVNNCHCDPIDWKSGKRFRGTGRTLKMLVEHFRARREADSRTGAATGLLTHHLDMDEPAWKFTESLLKLLSRHPAVRIKSADEVFSP